MKKLNYKNLDGILAALGEGEINLNQIVKALYQEKEILKKSEKKFFFFGKETQHRAIISSTGGFLTKIAKCCNPTIKNKIKAHITRSQGASIHKCNCPELLKTEKGRIANAHWDIEKKLNAKIELETINRIGLMKDITIVLSDFSINIDHLHSRANLKKDTVLICIDLEIKNLDQFVKILQKLEKVNGIINVKRI